MFKPPEIQDPPPLPRHHKKMQTLIELDKNENSTNGENLDEFYDNEAAVDEESIPLSGSQFHLPYRSQRVVTGIQTLYTHIQLCLRHEQKTMIR